MICSFSENRELPRFSFSMKGNVLARGCPWMLVVMTLCVLSCLTCRPSVVKCQAGRAGAACGVSRQLLNFQMVGLKSP